jgi:hypothetical protein
MNIFYFAFILLAFPAFAAGDPCATDYKNSNCLFDINVALSRYYKEDGKTPNKEYQLQVDKFYKKYGLEAFLYTQKNGYSTTLFEATFTDTEITPLKVSLLKAFPKGDVVNGKNIYRLMLPENPSSFGPNIKSYVYNAETLFPEKDNEHLQKNLELYGLPWEDESFLAGYLNEMKGLVKRIDESNEFFRRQANLPEKERLLKIIARLEPLAAISEKVCDYTKVEEIDEAKIAFPNLFSSSKKNVIGCLLKKQKCELVSDLINSGDYPTDKLGEYFDTIIHLGKSSACGNVMKSIYHSMLRNGNPIISNPTYTSVKFLQEIGVYYQKYPVEDQALCDSQFVVRRNNLDDLKEDFQKIMARQGFDLMKALLAEKDVQKKDALFNQFIELKGLDVDLGLLDPSTGKTILHLIAEAGDFGLIDRLIEKNVMPIELGDFVPNKEGVTPMEYAISSGEMNKLKFASRLYDAQYRQAGGMWEVHTYLKKLKTKDPEVKEFRDDFKLKVKEGLSHEY